MCGPSGCGFALGTGLAAVAGAVIYGFVEPSFRFDLSSLALVLGLAVAFLVISAAKQVSQYLFLGQAYDIRAFLRLFPAFGVVAIICVTLSRAIGLQPGLILGTLAALGTGAALSVRQKGLAAAVSAGSLTALGVLAWVLRGPFIEDRGFAYQLVAVALTAVAVAAAENLAFGLLPLSFLDGAALFAWSKPVWAGFSLLGAFAFVHVLLHREAGAFAERVTYLAILLAIYFTLAGLFWAYFHFTRRPEPAPSPSPADETA
ncbi:hypothetical protein EV643_102238 [Kribbella sp. VKM Ac-2527]|uniref:Uncharacterized protein n=1 Tax=Kribbella caucasensis TaxID=2512215 RepID=A0A4R6KPY2_9ACTN|nr:hypothetical protein [Kribbella sp. VKM Ac-2527]TDO52400.1 hypothetical protein EV643_102238 [Kribbella sp. VKM Ac-2527]